MIKDIKYKENEGRSDDTPVKVTADDRLDQKLET